MSKTVDRRRLLQMSAATPALLLAGANGKTPSTKPKTFVLAHGTWHGGWAWRDVRNQLEDLGHRVFTPTLTGCGERAHLSSPEVGLDTHIEDLAQVIRFEELDDVILVGHSFTGIAITGVVDRMKDRIAHVVYFDAIVPSDTRRAGVPRDEDGNLPSWFVERQKKFIDGYKMVLWEDYPIDMLLPPDSPHADRVRRLITTHPMRTWTDELVVENGGWQDMPRSFIHCVGQAYKMSSEKMVGPAREPGWNFVELDVPRDGMITHPTLVTETLLEIANR